MFHRVVPVLKSQGCATGRRPQQGIIGGFSQRLMQQPSGLTGPLLGHQGIGQTRQPGRYS